jgi:hypothetical protein
MFMSQSNSDDEVEALFGSLKSKPKIAKKPVNKSDNVKLKKIKDVVKSVSKAFKKIDLKMPANVVKTRELKAKAKKASAKKVAQPKKIKPKSYKVSGSFTLDSNGAVLKSTKPIHGILVSKKEFFVTFVVKRK